MAGIAEKREIRWLLLSGLREARRLGKSQQNGWVSQLMLLEILSVQGYDLTMEEMQDELEYLLGKSCIDKQRVGTRTNKYRISATGVDVLEEQVKIVGIGVEAGR